jgi:hypothetical protein
MWEQSSSYARRYRLLSGRAVNRQRSRLTHGSNTITEDIRSIWFAVIRRQRQQIYHPRRQPIESSYRSTERLEKNQKDFKYMCNEMNSSIPSQVYPSVTNAIHFIVENPKIYREPSPQHRNSENKIMARFFPQSLGDRVSLGFKLESLILQP